MRSNDKLAPRTRRVIRGTPVFFTDKHLNSSNWEWIEKNIDLQNRNEELEKQNVEYREIIIDGLKKGHRQ